ncbi:hypothetical protein [Vibrio proteolyticus]|uniref:Uncharacterized protein n=1 Tax=Vibrio proteolyticus NBRC 13287 TaxID=1219065 RepID=U2ZZY9_VIBPR|nr:hypothetical protein [Vibrio proteolyticus]GAD66662.1 hypothetical protein VPR01S_04_02660 [Vibrio proteolyticus NBRC 13287]
MSERSSIFEHSNARYLNSTQLADEFIWTYSFDRLLSNKNNIVLGSRGSGKTALVKMLSHEYLSKYNGDKARDIIKNNLLIGTYVPLKIEWVKTLDKDNDYFIWSLNLSSCSRLISTIKSLTKANIPDEIERVLCERSLSKKISEKWFSKPLTQLTHIEQELEDIEFKKHLAINKSKLGITLSDEELSNGIAFSLPLFEPFIQAVKIINRELSISDNSSWVLCIDEAEFLTEAQHIILNSQMRSYKELVFKITTMPYKHHSLNTDSSAPLAIGHDFEYLYVDNLGLESFSSEQKKRELFSFAESLLQSRLRSAGYSKEISLKDIFGESDLLDNPKETIGYDNFIALARENFDDVTKKRLNNYLEKGNRSLLNSSIINKTSGLLLLREAHKVFTGNSSPRIYSGSSLVAKCSDGNPRRLLRLYNFLLADKLKSKASQEQLKVSPNEQGRRLRDYSSIELENLNIEKNGTQAFDIISSIGRYIKEQTHNHKIATENISSVTFDYMDDDVWEHIKSAVDLGLLYPDLTKREDGNKMPVKSGVFCLAFCLSPHFFIMPRKGKTVSLSKILKQPKYKGLVNKIAHAKQLNQQMSLFSSNGDENE